nr:hypothetical protein [Candidatus Woesearchaeota archaeon]
MATVIYRTLEKANDPDDLAGLKKLMVSIFTLSLADLVNKNAPNNYSRSNYENALLWFKKTNQGYLFSFESICSISNLNSEAIREYLGINLETLTEKIIGRREGLKKRIKQCGTLRQEYKGKKIDEDY